MNSRPLRESMPRSRDVVLTYGELSTYKPRQCLRSFDPSTPTLLGKIKRMSVESIVLGAVMIHAAAAAGSSGLSTFLDQGRRRGAR